MIKHVFYAFSVAAASASDTIQMVRLDPVAATAVPEAYQKAYQIGWPPSFKGDRVGRAYRPGGIRLG
jgi:hypothetical protein